MSIRVRLAAPLSYCYRWLTDYSAEDPALEHGTYQRKVIAKGRGHAILEDLTYTESGWEWYRTNVTLDPPDRWHAELRGNVPDWSLDYRLRPDGNDRTVLTIRWRIRPWRGAPHGKLPSRTSTERMMRELWANFADSLEQEYRRERRPRRRPPPRSR